jgi:hypothetical protein
MNPVSRLRPWWIALVSFVTGFTTYAFLFGNPISERLIYSPDFGQSPKLLAVLQTMEPIPPLGPGWADLLSITGPKALTLGLLYLWAVGLVFIFRSVARSLPGRGWRRGLPFALILWAIAFPLLEFFFPLNVLGEPLPLVAYELTLELGLCLALAIPIAALTPEPA